MKLDLSYVTALPVFPLQAAHTNILIVGLGGTGSLLARPVACLVASVRAAGRDLSLTFVDPDRVEAVNIPRQNFCAAEIGRYKAETLAARYGQALGIEIECIPAAFSAAMASAFWNTLTLVVGCVDNAAARLSIEESLKPNDDGGITVPRIWWLDLGNGRDHGQALLGATTSLSLLKHSFTLNQVNACCSVLPSPLVQEPALREPRPEELAPQRLSCAELLVANAQGLTINAVLADIGADYLYRLLVTRDLKKFATYVDLPAGTMSSRYTTPRALARVLGQRPSFFHTHAPQKAKA